MGFAWLDWLGRYHYFFNDFPIVLIIMTVVAEGFGIWTKNEFYYQAARFMIISAAITIIPTVLLGFILSDVMHFNGIREAYFFWHQLLGLVTAGLCVSTAVLLECQKRGYIQSLVPYYICLTLTLVCVCWTGSLGGDLAFGD